MREPFSRAWFMEPCWLTIAIEVTLFAIGIWTYQKRTRAKDKNRSVCVPRFVLFLCWRMQARRLVLHHRREEVGNRHPVNLADDSLGLVV